MSLRQSFHYRCLRAKQTHFRITKEGRTLSKLKNIHQGRRCFIIGNGPSLRVDDLNILYRKGEISFAFNRIYHIFEKTPWRPTFYISQDDKMLKGCKDNVERLEAKVKFIPIQFKWYNDMHMEGATYFNFVVNESAGKPSFSEDIAKVIFNSNTVVFSAIQIAVYMGIHEIYLIGVDHHFHISQNAKGDIVVDPMAKDYFTDAYNEDKEELYIPNTDVSTLTYQSAQDYAIAHGIRIYNATRGGMLEVFPRVDFDTLFD